MKLEIASLEEKIQKLKRELVQIASRTGLNSHETLQCSQELDQYIIIYQKKSSKCLNSMI